MITKPHTDQQNNGPSATVLLSLHVAKASQYRRIYMEKGKSIKKTVEDVHPCTVDADIVNCLQKLETIYIRNRRGRC